MSLTSARALRTLTAPCSSPIEARAEAFANRASASFGSTRMRSSAIRRIIAARLEGVAASGADADGAARTTRPRVGGFAGSSGAGSGTVTLPARPITIPCPVIMTNSWNFSSGAVSFIDRTAIFRTIASPSRWRSMSITPSNGWETLETVAASCISFSRGKRAVTLWREGLALLILRKVRHLPTPDDRDARGMVPRTRPPAHTPARVAPRGPLDDDARALRHPAPHDGVKALDAGADAHLDHLFVRRDDEPGLRDVHRVFRRVVLREAHLADSEGSAKLALDLLEAQMDERIGDELLDPMGREAGAVRRLCNQEGRDVLVPEEPGEGEQPFPELPRRWIVKADRGQRINDKPLGTGALQGRGQELLQLPEADGGALRPRDPQFTEVDHEESAGPFEFLRVHPERPQDPREARLRFPQGDVHRRLVAEARPVVAEVEAEQTLPAPRRSSDEVHRPFRKAALHEAVEPLDSRRETFVHLRPPEPCEGRTGQRCPRVPSGPHQRRPRAADGPLAAPSTPR